MSQDKCCTIVPYFTLHEGKAGEFRAAADKCVEMASTEPGCLFYGFSYDGNQAHCREGYTDAQAALTHVGNIGPVLQEALKFSDLTRLEVHGPAEELAALRGPLAGLNPQFFTLEVGFRR